MGCDIHSAVQVRRDGVWQTITDKIFPPHSNSWPKPTRCPFDWRSYGMFGFLADVRNYSYVPSISQPRGMPKDTPYEEDKYGEYIYGDHSFSWLSLDELLAFDYDATFEDRRCVKQTAPNCFDHAADAGEGNGIKTTFREFLGPLFFRDLEIMRWLADDPANVRIVFGFDN